jgi:hypothetical protein
MEKEEEEHFVDDDNIVVITEKPVSYFFKEAFSFLKRVFVTL